MKSFAKLLLLTSLTLAAVGCGRGTMKVRLDSCQGIKTPLGWAECEEWHD